MFTLYLDDSGTRPTHRIAVASALIIPSAQIARLEKEWNAFTQNAGFTCFHASPFFAKDKRSEFSGWDDVKVARVYERVRQISKKYGVKAISASVNKEFFDDAMTGIPAEFQKYVGPYHYTWCVNYAIAYAEERWRNVVGRTLPPFEFVFDKMELNDPARKEIEKVLGYCERAAKELGREGEYANYSFRSKSNIPGLQCADAIAWTCNRFALYAFHRIHLPKLAEIGWKDYGGPLENGWLSAITFKREALQKWVKNMLADGRTIERFLRWEKEDTNK